MLRSRVAQEVLKRFPLLGPSARLGWDVAAVFGIWEGLSGNGWPALRSAQRSQGISLMSWDWIHLLRLSICFQHRDTSLQSGLFFFSIIFEQFWKRDTTERSHLRTRVTVSNWSDFWNGIMSKDEDKKTRGDKFQSRGKFHIQFATEVKGRHQSFPFLAIRLEKKKKKKGTSHQLAESKQTDEWDHFLLFREAR